MTHMSSSQLTFLKFKGHSIVVCVKTPCGNKKTVAINPVTKTPYVVWFVNNTSQLPGNGTIESPFPTLVQAQNSSAANDIIYVFPGNATDAGMNAGITLMEGQQLLGSGIAQRIATKQGILKIPAQSAGLPTISNTLSPLPTQKTAVVLNAGNNVVSGFNLMDNIGGGSQGGSDMSSCILIGGGLKNILSNIIRHQRQLRAGIRVGTASIYGVEVM